MDSKGLFTTNGSDILGANDVSFGLVIDYGRTLLRIDNPPAAGESGQLINHSFQGTLQFNYGILNQIILGLDVPVNLMTGDSITTQTSQWSGSQLNSQTLGFLALHAKWRITRVERGIGLALGAQIGVPVTNAPQSAGADSSFWYWPEAIVEKRFGSMVPASHQVERRVTAATRRAGRRSSRRQHVRRREPPHLQRRHLVPSSSIRST